MLDLKATKYPRKVTTAMSKQRWNKVIQAISKIFILDHTREKRLVKFFIN